MLQIAVIKPNTFTFENMSYDDVSGNPLAKTLREFVEIVKINSSSNDDILKNIVDNVGQLTDEARRTYKCHETPTNCFYLMYVSTDEETFKAEKSKNANGLAHLLSENHEPVLGKCVILNTSIAPNTTNCDITYEDVLMIVRSRVIHKAITVSPNGSIVESLYNMNPIENTHLKEENCRCYHIDFFNKVLCVFIEKVPSKGSINEHATIICKKLKVYGDVVIGILTKYPAREIMDIDKNLFGKILCVRSNTSSKDADGFSEEVLQGNFYSVLEKYVRKYENSVNESIPDDVMNGPSMNSTF
jgi:hypothetical protein